MYIWQHPKWPDFHWQDRAPLSERLAHSRLLQGILLGQADGLLPGALDRAELATLTESAVKTSAIEGLGLDEESVGLHAAQSVGWQLGHPYLPEARIAGVVAMLVDATRRTDVALTQDRLLGWQRGLFYGPSAETGDAGPGGLRGEGAMQVVSGPSEHLTIHYEAPPRGELDRELDRFLEWFNSPPEGLDPLLRAGIAHLWLVKLHPFEDGNGRVSRAVADLALAQADWQTARWYSLSAAIMRNRAGYYEILERTGRGDLDITAWLVWFLSTLEEALETACQRFRGMLVASRFWQQFANVSINQRQGKALNWLLEPGGEAPRGISASEYCSLVGASKASATRDLSDLVEKGCLVLLPGRGRSTRYMLCGI